MNTERDNHIRIITTDDGSHSLYHEELHETYHSTHGALRESLHVFIQSGLHILTEKPGIIRILEVGFGTGLNAWLTALESQKNKIEIKYITLEPHPIPSDISRHLNFANGSMNDHALLQSLHNAEWEKEIKISEQFTILKTTSSLQDFQSHESFDLVYYDAFGPPAQPEMWTADLLQKVAALMREGGIFVTYCAKGQVRRDLNLAGLLVERLPGPPGKREMLRAKKP